MYLSDKQLKEALELAREYAPSDYNYSNTPSRHRQLFAKAICTLIDHKVGEIAEARVRSWVQDEVRSIFGDLAEGLSDG